MADLTPADELMAEVWARVVALSPEQLRQLADWAKRDREHRAAMS
jgi:hypothetical protein